MPSVPIQPSPEAAFWARARPGVEPEDCWGWDGSHLKGYAIFSWRQRKIRGHVFACALLNGPCPEGLGALHKCGPNPGCVNPNHLAWGTQQENVDDCRADGTLVLGAGRGSKLSETDVLAIYHSPESHRVLARRYGLGKATVTAIKSGRTWAWLSNPNPEGRLEGS